jgi:hypothetical protein
MSSKEEYCARNSSGIEGGSENCLFARPNNFSLGALELLEIFRPGARLP